MMLGAIIGDIVGSTRERRNVKTEDFELLPEGSHFTDDTVMTLAVAKWLMEDPSHGTDSLVKIMQEMGRRYHHAGSANGCCLTILNHTAAMVMAPLCE